MEIRKFGIRAAISVILLTLIMCCLTVIIPIYGTPEMGILLVFLAAAVFGFFFGYFDGGENEE